MATKGKGKGSGNGFASLGLSEVVYSGIVRMGYRVSQTQSFSRLNIFLTYHCRTQHHQESNPGATKSIASDIEWCRYIRHGTDRFWENVRLFDTNGGETLATERATTTAPQ